MTKGNLVTRIITATDATLKHYPDDLDTAEAESAKTRVRGVTIHSRNGWNMLLSFHSGDDAAGDYFTLESGLYLTISADEQITDIYIKSVNAGGDVFEFMLSDSMIGAGISAGPSA